MSFVTQGCGNQLPFGAKWLNQARGLWERPCDGSTLADEVIRAFPGVDAETGALRPRVVMFRVLPDDYRPVEPEFRGARVDTGAGHLQIDMEKARECWRNKLRQDRRALLVELDALHTRAVGQGNAAEAKRIEAQRQRLRDMPADPRISAAKTLDELRGVTP